MSATIQMRRGTAAQWTASNPTLAAGEIGVETDTGKLKVGNGSTAWNSQSYSFISSTDVGVVTSTMIADGTIVNADINNSAAIAHSKLASASAGQILLGTTTTGVITATTISGDVTITGGGVTAIGSGVIVDADVNASAAIAASKISGTAVVRSDYTAKGVLLVGSGTSTTTALSAGTNNFVLTADSATASGLKWAQAVSSGEDDQIVIALQVFS